MTDSSLLPPSASSTERTIDTTTARISDIPTPLRTVWNPDTCPVDLLPWMAWGLGLKSWQPYWPERVKRAQLRAAVQIARRNGTRRSVQRAAENFGAGISIREWHQASPPAPPFTFEVLLTVGQFSGAASSDMQRDIIQEIDRAKPVRAHWTLQLGLQAVGGISVIGAARVAAFQRFTLRG